MRQEPNRPSRATLERSVRERARNHCEYCLCPADYSIAPFEIEHIKPLATGGPDELDNLALSCRGCNGHKSSREVARDPVSQTETPLFHPRQQSWNEHFGWSASFLNVLGQTPTGRATVDALHLNRPGVVNMRRLLLSAGLHPPEL